MMGEIIVVGYSTYDFAQTLVVGEVEFLDLDIDLSVFDSLIFTSKNAIRALEYNAKRNAKMQNWTKIPSYVIGKGSANELEKCGGNLAFIASDFYGDSFLLELLQKTKGQNLLYLRAKEVASNLDLKMRANGANLTSKIIYQNKKKNCSTLCKPPKNSTLLFTSPSAYRFFVEQFGWDSSYIAVALGKTTYASFSKEIQSFISPVQGIQKSVQYLKVTKSFSFS